MLTHTMASNDTYEIIDSHAHVFADPAVGLVPERLGGGAFPPSRLLELMDAEGVAKAVLLQNPTIGSLNELVARAIADHPDRFVGVIQVNPRSPEAVDRARSLAASPGQRTLKFEMSASHGWSGIHKGIRLDEPCFTALWDLAEAEGLNVVIDPGPIGGPGYQLDEIDAITGRHTNVRFLLEHLGFPRARDVDDAEAMAKQRRLVSLAARENVWLGCAAVPLLQDEEYPFPRSVGLLREAVETVGAERVVWGSDLPGTLRRHTYRELIDFVRRAATFLTDDQKRAVLAGNARTFWPQL